jgi:hypothetical protein
MSEGFDSLRRAAEQATRIGAADKALADGIDDVAQELRRATDKAREQLKALGLTDAEAERELAALIAELGDDGDDGRTLYHFTDPANVASIKKHGLLPSLGEHDIPAVWLTSFAGPVAGQVRITVHVRDDGKLEVHPPHDDNGEHWACYFGTIAPHDLKFPA